MRCVDILASFELEINKLNDALDKPVTDDSLYWINQAVVKFVKDRFNGNAPKRTSYEQNEKRTRDLIRLLREYTINSINYTNVLKEDDVYFPNKPTFERLDNNSLVQWDEVYEHRAGDKEVVKGSDVIYEKNTSEFLEESNVYFPEDKDFKDMDDDDIVQWEEVYKSKNGNREPVRMYNIISYDNPVESIIFIKYNTNNYSYDEYEYKYPTDMMFVLNEDVAISDLNDQNIMDTCVFECTADNFMYRVNNKLTDFHYRFHRARPLRIRTRDGFKLLTDKKYKIYSYTLGYLKKPDEIVNNNPYKDYTDFEDYTWLEIVKIAAQMYIENQSDPRYKTITNEVLTQE